MTRTVCRPEWLRGLFAVLPTPMRPGADLDPAGLDRLVEYYLGHGASGLVPVSLAGEGDRLDAAERRWVIRRVVRRAAGRVPVLAGVPAAHAEEALAQARAAAQDGVQGLLLRLPDGDDQAVLGCAWAVGRSTRLPLVLIDHPGFGPRLPLPLIGKLAESVPQVCGLKVEDPPTADKIARLRALLGERLRLFGGLCGMHGLAELEHGADGFFTGFARPDLLVALMARCRAGDAAGARAMFQALQGLAAEEGRHADGPVGRRKRWLREFGILASDTMRPRGLATPPAGPPDCMRDAIDAPAVRPVQEPILSA